MHCSSSVRCVSEGRPGRAVQSAERSVAVRAATSSRCSTTGRPASDERRRVWRATSSSSAPGPRPPRRRARSAVIVRAASILERNSRVGSGSAGRRLPMRRRQAAGSAPSRDREGCGHPRVDEGGTTTLPVDERQSRGRTRMKQVDGHAPARRASGGHACEHGGLEHMAGPERPNHEATPWIDPRAEQPGACLRPDEQAEADGHPSHGEAHPRTRHAPAAAVASAATPRSPWCCEAHSWRLAACDRASNGP